MATEPNTDKARGRKAWSGLMKLGVTAILLAVIFHFISFEDIWIGIRRTSPLIWLSVLAGFLIGHVLAAFKWGLLVGQGLSFSTIVRAHFAGLAANIALPGVAGGDVARAAVLASKIESRHRLITGSIIDRLIDVAILVAIAALGAALMGTAGQTGVWLQVFAAVLVILGGGVYIALPGIAAWLEAHLTGAGKLPMLVKEIATYMAGHRNRILVCAALSFAIQVGFVCLNVVLAWSMQGPTNLAVWLFAWPLAKLIATLPISLGGLGVREASLAAVFAAFATASPVVIAVGFVWQTILITTGLVGLGVQFLSRKRNSEPSGGTNVGPNAR